MRASSSSPLLVEVMASGDETLKERWQNEQVAISLKRWLLKALRTKCLMEVRGSRYKETIRWLWSGRQK